jgi:hypothetical protein
MTAKGCFEPVRIGLLARAPQVTLQVWQWRTLFFYSACHSDADFIDANLSGARWPSNTPVPASWRLDGDSGRLRQVSANPEPTE